MSTGSRAWRAGSLRVATRGSPLALAQARAVCRRLEAATASATELVVVRTAGDIATDVPVDRLAGQGAFVKEVQLSVLEGRADLAVHSAKDLPSASPPELVLACVPERADPRDALIGATLRDLPPGARVATGSARRRAQLAWLRPDLTFGELRGNMQTRLERSRAAGAGVVAFAALARLGLEHEVDELLDPLTMLPQVGQGSVAVECRRADLRLIEVLGAIDDPAAHRALRAERAFLAAVGGGCTLPLGALARPSVDGEGLRVEAMVASGDGRVLLRGAAEGDDPEAMGAGLADDLLRGAGGELLEEWRG